MTQVAQPSIRSRRDVTAAASRTHPGSLERSTRLRPEPSVVTRPLVVVPLTTMDTAGVRAMARACEVADVVHAGRVEAIRLRLPETGTGIGLPAWVGRSEEEPWSLVGEHRWPLVSVRACASRLARTAALGVPVHAVLVTSALRGLDAGELFSCWGRIRGVRACWLSGD